LALQYGRLRRGRSSRRCPRSVFFIAHRRNQIRGSFLPQSGHRGPLPESRFKPIRSPISAPREAAGGSLRDGASSSVCWAELRSHRWILKWPATMLTLRKTALLQALGVYS
jgi:hypothetical protein